MRYLEGRRVAYSSSEFIVLTKMRERFAEIDDPAEWLMLNELALDVIEEEQQRGWWAI